MKFSIKFNTTKIYNTHIYNIINSFVIDDSFCDEYYAFINYIDELHADMIFRKQFRF